MTQPSLFEAVAVERSPSRFVQKDLCANRHGGNPESEAAHQRVKSTKVDMWSRILAWALTQPRGFTADACTAAFGGNPNHVAPRISELLAQGRLVRTEERRKTRSGCRAAVLVVKR